MIVVPLALTQPIWKNVSKFGTEYVKLNPLQGFVESYLTLDSPAAFPACLDFANSPLENLSNGHVGNNTFHHCVVSFGLAQLDLQLRGLRGVETIYLDNNCYIVTASVETWYDLIVTWLTPRTKNKQVKQILCHIILHLERIGFREMFIKFEKIKLTEHVFYIKEV